MKYSTRQHLAILGAATLAFTGAEADAGTIFSEDFQTNTPNADYRLQASDDGGLTGWSFPGNNIFMLRDTDDSLPGAGLTPNYGIQTEWSNGYASYDTTHNWSSGDVFTVDFNATEQNWSNAKERIVRVRIRETGGGIVWQGDTVLAQYDGANTGSGGNWAPNQTHQLNFSASDFGTVFGTSAGTEGTLLTFEIGQTKTDLVDGSGYANESRGAYIDNIEFSVVPEPGSLALLGLGGLLIARRRR